MSQGTLYATESIRTLLLKALVKHYKLDISVSDKDALYAKAFPLGKVPAFIGPKGYKLTEVIAIVLYCEYLFNYNALFVNCNDETYYHFLNSYPCLNKLCRELSLDSEISIAKEPRFFYIKLTFPLNLY